MQRLDILRLVQDWVVHGELLLALRGLAPADIGLDPLLKLRPCPLL